VFWFFTRALCLKFLRSHDSFFLPLLERSCHSAVARASEREEVVVLIRRFHDFPKGWLPMGDTRMFV